MCTYITDYFTNITYASLKELMKNQNTPTAPALKNQMVIMQTCLQKEQGSRYLLSQWVFIYYLLVYLQIVHLGYGYFCLTIYSLWSSQFGIITPMSWYFQNIPFAPFLCIICRRWVFVCWCRKKIHESCYIIGLLKFPTRICTKAAQNW